jgi:putative FmdB family regulatory protein
MPVYEYSCKNCGHKFEKLRAMREADQLILCLNCMSPDTHRMLSRFNAKSDGRSLTDSSCSCGGCNGGSCGSCGSCNSRNN